MKDRIKQINRGFTLVEMLVVIAIIVILAGILVPVIARAKTKAKVATAKIQMTELDMAIKSYKNDYERYPVPKGVPSTLGKDITFGGKQDMSDPYENDGLMGILISPNDPRNPKKNIYLKPKRSEEVSSQKVPGLSTDGFYIDPFGNEYVITMDKNRDGLCVDEWYGRKQVSFKYSIGLVGVKWDNVKGKCEKAPTGTKPDLYAYDGEVMIWSAGPDRDRSRAVGALDGSNSDNILHWN